MSTTPEPTPCDHKWVTYQFIEADKPERICDVCGVNERDVPVPESKEATPATNQPSLMERICHWIHGCTATQKR